MVTSKKGFKLSTILTYFVVLLAGFAVGINVGSQLFTERPDFVSSILLAIIVLGCIIIPGVKKKEKEGMSTGLER